MLAGHRAAAAAVGVSDNSSSSLARSYTTHAALPEEHRMIYDMCRKFADEELAPNATSWDKKHEFPVDAVTKLVRLFWCCCFICM